MNTYLLFAILSVPIVFASLRSLVRVKSHGFYRFFGWEGLLWLLVSNYKYWFVDPFSTAQLFSWCFLFLSVYLAVTGGYSLLKRGKPTHERDDKALFHFEKTSQLVDTGIYRYIRHPLYASLLYLSWGIFLKHATLPLFVVALITSVFYYLTSINDEKECLAYFGQQYRDYMKRSKMFLPFIF